MTKNQKMLLGLGAVAVVGYLVYQNNKPKGFYGETKKPFAGERKVAFGAVAPLEVCPYSPENSQVAGTIGGRDVYACCAPGMVAYQPSNLLCEDKPKSMPRPRSGGTRPRGGVRTGQFQQVGQ